ncbi:hypothetical protein FOZ62_013693 [Perkinsus olseni]|uniref:Uncharacterized protein n=1 Tax=Perkinsus olseni TaxID=32597 RepID=A0A7J6R877_PEROL|nr:hypothetical protein FOZ62_013693 [Perkinsus olseni]
MWKADVRAGYYKPRYRNDDVDHDQLEGLYLPRGSMATSDAEVSAFQDALLSASNPREYEPLDVVSDSRRNGFADICPCAVAQRGPHDGHTYHYPYERFMP